MHSYNPNRQRVADVFENHRVQLSILLGERRSGSRTLCHVHNTIPLNVLVFKSSVMRVPDLTKLVRWEGWWVRKMLPFADSGCPALPLPYFSDATIAGHTWICRHRSMPFQRRLFQGATWFHLAATPLDLRRQSRRALICETTGLHQTRQLSCPSMLPSLRLLPARDSQHARIIR